MIIDYKLIDTLALEFLRKRGTNYYTGDLLPGDDTTSLGSTSQKFEHLYVKTLHADSLTATGASSDKVDGYHASSTPTPGYLLALDSTGKFPAAALGNAVLKTGDTITGDIKVAAGVTIDGVDLSVFKAEYDAYITGAGGVIVPHSHENLEQGGDLPIFAHSEGNGTRPAYKAIRLEQSISAGRGLSGGGKLDQTVNLDVDAADGLGFDTDGRLVLSTPGTISSSTANNAVGAHTHSVDASYDPGVAAELLRTNDSGALRVQALGIGNAAIPAAGNIAASGDVSATQILSTQDTFVGNNLHVGDTLLNTRLTTGSVMINRETADPTLQGALTVRPKAANQRGVVIQGKSGQEQAAPLLSVANADGDDLVRVLADGTLEGGSPAFVSGLTGWRINGEGDAEFRNITARGELHTSVFVANEMHAAGGTLAVMSTGVVANPVNATDNLVNTTFNLVIAGDPNLPGVCPFQLNDVLRAKLMMGLQEN